MNKKLQVLLTLTLVLSINGLFAQTVELPVKNSGYTYHAGGNHPTSGTTWRETVIFEVGKLELKYQHGYTRDIYVNFDISDLVGTPTNAKLKLYLNQSSSSTFSYAPALYGYPQELKVSWVDASAMDFSTFVYLGAPTTITEANIGSYVEFDVTNYINDMVSASTNVFCIRVLLPRVTTTALLTFDDNTATNKPVLELTGDGVTTDIDEKAATAVSIYPNPVSDQLFINHAATISSVKIMNLSGASVATQQNVNDVTASINVQNLNDGVYILQVVDMNGNVTAKKVRIKK